MGISIEKVIEIWDDKSGDHYEIGADRDGLDMLEIRYYVKGEYTSTDRMAFSIENAEHIVKAMQEYLKQQRGKDEK